MLNDGPGAATAMSGEMVARRIAAVPASRAAVRKALVGGDALPESAVSGASTGVAPNSATCAAIWSAQMRRTARSFAWHATNTFAPASERPANCGSAHWASTSRVAQPAPQSAHATAPAARRTPATLLAWRTAHPERLLINSSCSAQVARPPGKTSTTRTSSCCASLLVPSRPLGAKCQDTISREVLAEGCLLCSEDKPHHCHRRIVAEYFKQHWGRSGHCPSRRRQRPTAPAGAAAAPLRSRRGRCCVRRG